MTLIQVRSHCPTVPARIQAACVLALQVVGRLMTVCHQLYDYGVNEARRQQCWCRRSVEPAATAAVTYCTELSHDVCTLAAHWNGRSGSLCVRECATCM